MQSMAAAALPSTALAVTDTEVEMQVYGDDGSWHRLAIGEATMACGELVPRGALRRHPSYDGKLCADGCFSRHEIRLNVKALGAIVKP